jgi:hypothetical protein
VGGANFYARLPIPCDSLHLRYDVRFADDFAFVKGGKLPGLFGGKVTGRLQSPDGTNGFSTRYMWRAEGAGELYAYLPRLRTNSAGQVYVDLPRSPTPGRSIGQGSWTFSPKQWYRLEQRVVLNTPGRLDGRIQVWVYREDGKLLSHFNEEKLLFRTVQHLKIEGIFFSTFFGGHDPTWATPRTTYADFARFALWSDRS